MEEMAFEVIETGKVYIMIIYTGLMTSRDNRF